MVLCDKNCIPCCDYCIHSVHEFHHINGNTIEGGCIGCYKHPDEEHNYIAAGCGYCEDFHCKNVSKWHAMEPLHPNALGDMLLVERYSNGIKN